MVIMVMGQGASTRDRIHAVPALAHVIVREAIGASRGEWETVRIRLVAAAAATARVSAYPAGNRMAMHMNLPMKMHMHITTPATLMKM